MTNIKGARTILVALCMKVSFCDALVFHTCQKVEKPYLVLIWFFYRKPAFYDKRSGCRSKQVLLYYYSGVQAAPPGRRSLHDLHLDEG